MRHERVTADCKVSKENKKRITPNTEKFYDQINNLTH